MSTGPSPSCGGVDLTNPAFSAYRIANLGIGLSVKVAGVPIAAGALYPVTGVLLSPMIAALAMALSSVSVIGNALRLRAVGLP